MLAEDSGFSPSRALRVGKVSRLGLHLQSGSCRRGSWEEADGDTGGARGGGGRPPQLPPRRFVNSSDTDGPTGPESLAPTTTALQLTDLRSQRCRPRGLPVLSGWQVQPDGPRKNAQVSSAEWGDRPMPGPGSRGTSEMSPIELRRPAKLPSATSVTSHRQPGPRFLPERE